MHDGVGGRSTVVLAGSGLPGNVPLLRASPGAVSFGVTQVGDAPVLQTVTLRNEGNAPLTSIELGTTGVDFALEHNGCGGALPLAMGQTCQLQLAFRPTRAGNFSAGLRIAGAGLSEVVRLPLYGGAALDRALLQASPSRLPFEETVGQASVQELVIVNRGAVATRVSSLALNGPGATEFAVEPRTTCQPGSLLAPGAGCIIALRFAPATAGLRAARVQVLTDGSDTPVAVAELAGTAHAQAAPRLLLDAVALTFAEQVVGSATAGVPLQVTAHNAGRGTLRWDTIQVVGDHAADFAIDGECLTSPTLAAGASCRLQLHFRPQAAGLRSASLRLAPATGTPLALVSLAGRAATVATAQPSPGKAALDLGSAPRGNRLDSGPWLDWQASATTPTHTGTGLGQVTLGPAWTVVNRGNATSEPLRWRIAGDAAADYSIDPASSCVSGAVLPAGGACFVRVRFHPGAGGAATDHRRRDADPGPRRPVPGAGGRHAGRCADGRGLPGAAWPDAHGAERDVAQRRCSGIARAVDLVAARGLHAERAGPRRLPRRGLRPVAGAELPGRGGLDGQCGRRQRCPSGGHRQRRVGRIVRTGHRE